MERLRASDKHGPQNRGKDLVKKLPGGSALSQMIGRLAVGSRRRQGSGLLNPARRAHSPRCFNHGLPEISERVQRFFNLCTAVFDS